MPVCDTGDFDGNGEDPGRAVETRPLSHTSDRGLNVRGAGQEKHEWGGAPKSLLGYTWSQSTTQHMNPAALRPRVTRQSSDSREESD